MILTPKMKFERLEKAMNNRGQVYSNGNKHSYLVTLAGRCNSAGLDQSFVADKLRFYSTAPGADFVPFENINKIVEKVYTSYASQHNTLPLEEAITTSNTWTLPEPKEAPSKPANEPQVKKSYKGFPMTFDYEIKQQEPAIKFVGHPLIYNGEIATIVALPGSGKTQAMEAAGCGFIANKNNLRLDYDCLGLEFTNTAGKMALIADTERTYDDARKSFNRMHKRLGNNPQMIENGEFKDLTFLCLIDADNIQQRKDALEHYVSTGKYSLVIIDGILDFCKDGMINGEDASEVVRWLRSLANKYQFAAITTMHPNKGTEIMAGHIGGYLYRWSRACLLISRHPDDEETKVITRRFGQGKASHAGELPDVYFRYDEDAGMMVLCDQPESQRINYNEQEIKKIFNSYLISNGQNSITSSELKELYASAINVKDRTAQKHILEAAKDGLLEKQGSSRGTSYVLVNNST